MESDYDQKFEDMKKYIPFLESMIKRLESTNAISANPRQAQLDKIRSLRDLLLDKKKRMKMENLIKCEQVLINLYAKVEQRDTLPKRTSGSSTFESSKMENNSHLEIVRNKLKRVSKIQDEAGTLPEIVRASDIEDVCTAGSVEPALFQRRPHKKSPTLSDISSNSQEKVKPPETNSTRKYTRVLISPERDRVRSTSQESLDTVLFSRRSPRRSSSYTRRDSKKSSSSNTSSGNTKDFNITLKVPEESLNSLNTKDILSRIITCNDNDVDIDTLRGLRTQILSELKQTGANDDISDLILKSYAGMKPKTNKQEEIEEGELSDSESEAIESIYGSLVLVDKDKSKSEEKSVPEKDQPRKIQICLVINSKDNETTSNKDTLTSVQNVNDECALEMFNKVKEDTKIQSKCDENKKIAELKPTSETKETSDSVVSIEDVDNVKVHDSQQTTAKATEVKNNEDNTGQHGESIDWVIDKKDNNLTDKETINLASPDPPEQVDKKSVASVLFKANFYKPLQEEESNLPLKYTTSNTKDNKSTEPEKQNLSRILSTKDDSVEIPLLNEPVIAEKPVEKDIDSQIDILQALKNEILADSISHVPNLDVVTPPLHQPKISKVAVQGVSTKKRISIEKYKEKTTPVSITTMVNNDVLNSPIRDDNLKKQSLKLTEKECERFNFPTKLNINDDLSSEDEGLKQSNLEHDVYKNFAPKSPDHDDTRLVANTQPVIIPVDPVKGSVVSMSADIDMRTIPLLSKNNPAATSTSSLINKNKKNDTKPDKTDDVSGRKSPLIDPRMKKDLNQSVKWDNSSLAGINLDAMAKSLSSNVIYSAITTPSRTAKSISFDISPNQKNIESDVANTPVLNNLCSPRNSETDIASRKSRWDADDSRYNVQTNTNIQSSRYGDAYKRDKNLEKNFIDEKNVDAGRSVMPLTPLPVFGWPDNSGITKQFSRPEASIPPLMNFGKPDSPTMPNLPFGHSECPSTLTQNFRSDMPVTPNHQFGRTDCPMTPNHPFGRSDCPGTPIHPFGRSDCPATPSHPFGRTDCPPTPIHSFGRLDCPATPSHPFGRSDCPATPSHPFGRLDNGPPTSNNAFGRIDFPGTQSHPYGMTDCPTTPSHPFGRSDCPPTPSHPFSRLDCPPTPSHPFGMSECPQTPSHPFGRGETLTPNYSFNRGDHSQNISLNKQFSKDPRLNRRSEYDPRYRRDERNHGNYSDRGFSSDSSYHKQNRSYGKSDHYMNYDREVSDRRPRRSDSRLERSFSREMSRDNEKDQLSYSERSSSYKYVDRSRRRERDGEDRYRRERSGERSQDSCESVQSRSRDKSVGRSSNKEINNYNKLSITPDAGRSFTIDTSVNSTFQDLLKKKGIELRDPSFDTRRNRAASVGRSKESYCDKSFADPSSQSATTNNSENKNRNFRRSSSVGRDLHRYNDNRSYQEIKKDFQNYKSNYKITDNAMDNKKLCDSMNKTLEENTRNKIHNDNQEVTSSSTKQPYSPRKNYRDPRMRRDCEDKKNRYGFEKNKYGFSYSSDSFAKGSVLHSGYGVKNYKIPKIKRPNNETQSKDKLSDETLESVESKPKKGDLEISKDTYKQSSDDNKDVSNRSPERRTLDPTETKIKKTEAKTSKDLKNKKDLYEIKDILGGSSGRKVLESIDTKFKKDELKTLKDTHGKQSLDDSKDISDDSPGRRITRSSKKQGVEVKSVTSTKEDISKRKYKKILKEFDSDSDSSNQEVEDKNYSSDDDKPIKSKYRDGKKTIQTQKVSQPKDDTDNEIFFDNVSDPVIDNINALIDDLDNHINSSGNDAVHDFTKDVTFDCQENKAASVIISQKENVDAQSKYLEEVQNNDSKTEIIESSDKTVDLKQSSARSELSSGEKSDVETLSQSEKNTNIEIIDSTTGKGSCIVGMDNELGEKNVESFDGNIATSPADSTNELIKNKPSEHIVPDSTNEVNSEMNSDVSSSLISADVPTKDFTEPGSSGQETVPSFDSIGSLLSILQDKSKIHQLLSMLGEQSGDNDKIKRKLEKLSEIVSDDEEETTNHTDSKEDNIMNKDIASEISKSYDNEENIKETSQCDKVESTETENTKSNTDDEQIVDISSDALLQNVQVGVQNDKDSSMTDTSEVVTIKKGKGPKKGKGKIIKTNKVQRITRAAVAQADKPPATKKLSRELLKLREDIKEMFLTDEMLNSTGIRMCRLAKFVDETNTNRKEDATQNDPKPVVVIEKFKNQDKTIEPITPTDKSAKKKPSFKPKRKTSGNDEDVQEDNKMDNTKLKATTKNVLVSKSKIKVSSKQLELDPYEFETDSVETSTVKESESEGYSDIDNASLASSLSFGSSELLADLQKKTKRKRRGKAWQTGIIKPKNRKKKVVKTPDIALAEDSIITDSNIAIPDKNCFIDKYYCFQKNVSSYSCRLCVYTGDDIVIHYKQQHPHTEIPLSRMNPNTAKEAIQQCQEVNFPAISKISTDKYVCRFCFKDFSKNKTVLESFFWHIVSMHTGEYKQTCSECDPEPCYFNLDIPPPPKENKGQLIGYLCGKCNFTQVSLENLKTHVIGRHNDEQTDVYTINLSAMTRKTIKTLTKHQNTIATRTLRSSNSNRSISDNVDDTSEQSEISSLNESIALKEEQDASPKKEEKTILTSIQSKIAFESDENIAVPERALNENDNSVEIKQERFENDIDNPSNTEEHAESEVPISNEMEAQTSLEEPQQGMPDDILDYAHFKVAYKDSGVKEYVCCINGIEHYRTSLMISMKKHVQLKHDENWDGFCFVCKVIITPPGQHSFKECLQHFFDRHMDEFPVMEPLTEVFNDDPPENISCDVSVEGPKYINVRPIEQLVSGSNHIDAINDSSTTVPIIESVVSLNNFVDVPQPSPNYVSVSSMDKQEIKQYKYEEWQEVVTSKKHRVVLSAMMTKEKLIKIYKCTGRFCSFTSDNAEHSLVHAMTHQRIGGEGAMSCAYCDFDACNNGIDLVTHVFKAHGNTQYACGLCFYRGLASQLVNSHMNRKHPNKQANDYVLHTVNDIKPVTEDSDNILVREVAVPSYICGQTTLEAEGGPCNFRSYTPAQLCDHLQQRHQPPYPCNTCPSVMNAASDLVNHMKEHGYRLYQCTFCVFGADNEKEMLDHASACHPMRLPQAYLRIITNKDGNQQLKVLPRVYLNKCKVKTEDVPSDVADDPIKEAERCIELEKLIGPMDTTIQISSVESIAKPLVADTSKAAVVVQDSQPPIQSKGKAVEATPTIAPMVDEINEHQVEPTVIKTEPNTDEPSTSKASDSVVYCLDSDDEEPVPRVIDLSDEDPITTQPTEATSVPETVTYKKLSMAELYVCPICKVLCKNSRGFKKHLNACNSTWSTKLKCPHECTVIVPTCTHLADHYVRDHSNVSLMIYVCGVCNAKYKSMGAAKQHMKGLHKTQHFDQNPSPKVIGGNRVLVITPITAAQKASGLRRRYGPEDIDKLPINPILDNLVFCALCEFNTKVRLNMVRHLQLHSQQQSVPQTAPVNPVPHLETNERHFDKMVNLASSSIINRAIDKPARSETSSPVTFVSAETANRYPKYVPDRQRYTCGAKGCSYISVDEAMFRCHWDTLHSNTNDYHCVHCPPHQHLDTSRPLTSARIIGHLKMHDDTLYACSACSYYHHKRNAMEKHLGMEHKGAQLITVRMEGGSAPPLQASAPAAVPPSIAPTMDLKPWQCGLCKFKSMLRPEVAEHCAKVHQSKMQYRCNYCPFRTSTIENVTKHQLKSHPEKKEDVFYYYYREGSIPDEDGTPRWVKQNQKSANPETVVKCEVPEPTQPALPPPAVLRAATPAPPAPLAVDLNLVKQEVEEIETMSGIELSIEELCKKFGEFCEPKDLQYKCSLCTVVVEATMEAMQSHLYEELKYRKWGCGLCSYKAFHKAGLSQHMTSEHRGRYEEPIELQTDVNVEKWVIGQLDYQTSLIEKHQDDVRMAEEQSRITEAAVRSLEMASGSSEVPTQTVQNQSAVVQIQSAEPLMKIAKVKGRSTRMHRRSVEVQTASTPSTSTAPESTVPEVSPKYLEELEQAFGPFGAPRNGLFCCPRCSCTLKEEKVMKEHLESELNKIRWTCNHCSFKSQIYHEAQFHCKTAHIDGARPVEAVRSVVKRAHWVFLVLRKQKQAMNSPPPEPISPEKPTEATEPQENSLLVVRYEERVPTPENVVNRKRVAPPDSDEEKLVIDESGPSKKKLKEKPCPHCEFTTKWNNALREHILRHYNLKPFKCPYCAFLGHRYVLIRHLQSQHADQESHMLNTPVPTYPPIFLTLPKHNERKVWDNCSNFTSVCLHCERAFREKNVSKHVHENLTPAFGKIGENVLKCGICSTYHVDLKSFQNHHKATHGDVPVDYAYYKMECDTREYYYCDHCNNRFSLLSDLKSHHSSTHKDSDVKYSTAYSGVATNNEECNNKRKSQNTTHEPNPKRFAKKSTTKLPFGNTVARKSTTKLPFNEEISVPQEYSFYGKKPTPIEEYENVTTLMPFCNTMVPFTIKKLSEIIKIEPIVRVKDVRK